LVELKLPNGYWEIRCDKESKDNLINQGLMA
jgi:hypothetical protein